MAAKGTNAKEKFKSEPVRIEWNKGSKKKNK